MQQLPQRASEAAEAPAAEPAPLAWLPATLAAVALRLQALDAAAIYADSSQPARDTLLVRFCPAAFQLRSFFLLLRRSTAC